MLTLAHFAEVSVAGPIAPSSALLRDYLVIGTGGSGNEGGDFRSFQQSDTEIGADQEIVSPSDNGTTTEGTTTQRTGSLPSGSSPNLFDVFENRWNNDDPDPHPDDVVGDPDTLTGARPIFEGIDFSGNVALTGERGTFDSSNSDVNADIGIQCNRATGCFPEPSGDGNSYFSGAVGDPELDLNAGNGISQFDPTDLNTELANFRVFVNSLTADARITSNIEDQSVAETAAASLFTNLDNIDAGVATGGVTVVAGSSGHGDGIAVVDIDVGFEGKFSVTNSDWILTTELDTFVIFRMTNNGNYEFNNSSIVLGGVGGIIQTWGALFFVDQLSGTSTLFEVSNSILGGLALWDLVDFNIPSIPPESDPEFDSTIATIADINGDRVGVNLQNAQGCAQFIGHKVIMSNLRWTRCAADSPLDVPEPGTLALFGIGLIGLGYMRRRRKTA